MKPLKMEKRRLLHLARWLRERIPRKVLDMNSYGCTEGSVPKARECGSEACALGWATTIPSFKRAGFVAESDTYSCPHYKHLRGTPAAAKFFGITYDDAERLFGGSTYGNTPKAVARNIERFVAEHV